MMQKSIINGQPPKKRYLDKEASDKYIKNLRDTINRTYVDMSKFTQSSQKWIDIKEAEKQTAQQRIMNELYQARMMMACIDTFRNGISAESVLAMAGMYAGFSFLCPGVKSTVQKFNAEALGSVLNKITSADIKLPGQKKWLPVLQQQKEKYIKAANGGRIPFTAETAAVADICMCREAYYELRSNLYNPEDVMARLGKARANLQRLANLDGVDRGEMVRMQHLIAGQIRETDPNMAHIFSELSYDSVRKAPSEPMHTVVYDKNGNVSVKTHHIWRGEYVDSDGQPITEMFSVREPLSEKTYAAMISRIAMEHDGAYDLSDPASMQLARDNMKQAFLSAMGYVDAKCTGPDACKAAYDRASAEFAKCVAYAQDDWRVQPGYADRLTAATEMGFMYAQTAETAYSLYEKYGDDDLDAPYAADMSAIAMEFTGYMKGIKPGTGEWAQHAETVATWYTTSCIRSDLDLDDEDDGFLRDYLQKNPEALKYKKVYASLLSTMAAYGDAVYRSVSVGNSFEDSLDFVKQAEDDAASAWVAPEGVDSIARDESLKISREMAHNVMAQYAGQGVFGKSKRGVKMAKQTKHEDFGVEWVDDEDDFGLD